MASSDIIETAIERLDKDGWVQGFMFDGRRRCIRGAMHGVCKEQLYEPTFLGSTEIAKAEQIVAGVISTGTFSDKLEFAQIIVKYNDTEGRTKEEVIDKLTEAAKVARNAGD